MSSWRNPLTHSNTPQTHTFTLRFSFYRRFCFRSVHSWHTYLLCLCVNVYWADRFMHSCHRIVFARNTRCACRNAKRSRHKNVLLEHLYCTNLGIDRNQNIGNKSYFRVIAANCWHIRPIYAWLVYVIHDTVTVNMFPVPQIQSHLQQIIYNLLLPKSHRMMSAAVNRWKAISTCAHRIAMLTLMSWVTAGLSRRPFKNTKSVSFAPAISVES